MEKALGDIILHVCNVLNKHSVQYILVGGTAVALHGYFRHSISQDGVISDKPDLDFWYNPTYGNYFNLLNALEELGQNVSQYREEQRPDPKNSFFRYQLEKFNLDLLPRLKAPLKFGDSFTRKEIVTFKRIEIPFINYDDLILDKETNARPKDKTDIEELKKKKKG